MAFKLSGKLPLWERVALNRTLLSFSPLILNHCYTKRISYHFINQPQSFLTLLRAGNSKPGKGWGSQPEDIYAAMIRSPIHLGTKMIKCLIPLDTILKKYIEAIVENKRKIHLRTSLNSQGSRSSLN